MTEITRILTAIDQGDSHASDQLLPLVYDELRCLAAQRLSQEKPGQTLQATALVHEAYIRLVGGNEKTDWNNRGHFFAAAAEAMRKILIDSARKKRRQKRGGNLQRVDIDCIDVATASPPEQLLALDDAIAKLSEEDSSAAALVKLRMFSGLSIDQAAKAMGTSTATAYRHWSFARAWLHCELLQAGS